MRTDHEGSQSEGQRMGRGVAGFSGATLRRLRERQRPKMTLDRLAYLTHVSENTVTRWENGHSAPTPDNLRAVAEALGVLPADLLPGRKGRDQSLRDLRILAGKSVDVAARDASLSASALGRFERGSHWPTPAAIKSLAALYKVTTAEIEAAASIGQERRAATHAIRPES